MRWSVYEVDGGEDPPKISFYFRNKILDLRNIILSRKK
jgi:hypothetical protein